MCVAFSGGGLEKIGLDPEGKRFIMRASLKGFGLKARRKKG